MSTVAIGIDLGSINLKICALDEDNQAHCLIAPHDGNLERTLHALLSRLELDGKSYALATGTEGRHRLQLPQEIAPVCVERGLRAAQLHPVAVVSMGGEDMVVYRLDAQGQVVSSYAGNKCASGTGEFLRQQLGRMDLDLKDLDNISDDAKVYRLSARCSVFMKSDCTHRLNKGEATKADIALSLSKVMADKVSDFLVKAHITHGQVALIGGVTQNRHLVRFLRERWPHVDFVVPPHAASFEAYGAAHLAREKEYLLPLQAELVAEASGFRFESMPPLEDAQSRVRYAESRRGEYVANAEYILGIDGGSTTTKVALIRKDTLEIVAAHYGRTHGDPIAALRICLQKVQAQIGNAKPKICLAATTGSSRELLGVFTETKGVYNEIIAHAVGTTYFEPNADTLFEIGGQDAKFVMLNNGVPIDYAMNEACSAGTGSFLEESASGDLCIERAEDIGPEALKATAPLKFGEHCSAFINSDIRKAVQQGAAMADIVAGLVYSITQNYLNRVVGNRHIGEYIVLQGGVAKNPAIPLAFAQITKKMITVPPDPELMGCFGVARLAQQKHDNGLLAAGDFDLDTLINKHISYRGHFTCKSCDNFCEIRRLEVSGQRYPFGGRCSLYTNKHKQKPDAASSKDYTETRREMLFSEYVPDAASLVQRSDEVIGVPRAFSVHSLWPMYAWFFHNLGVRAVLTEKIVPEGIARQESNYCYPAEIAHGAIQDALDRGVDRLFLPQFRDMPSLEKGKVHACTCPLTQGLPFFARHAFALEEEKMLRPLVSFKHGWQASQTSFEEMAKNLGFTRFEGAAAYRKAVREYQRFLLAYRELGDKILDEVRANPKQIYVALLGRPYNAFTRDANMGIPRKFTSNGITVIPYDMIFAPDAEIFPNMYWYYGQQDMKAVSRVKEIPNLFLCWISNFSCAPDSFMLHYVRWMMGDKPYLVLEIDSHTADAGVDTRIEAFLDVVESYRLHVLPTPIRPFQRRYHIEFKKAFCDVIDTHTQERFDIRDPRVTFVWPSMGDLAAEAATVATSRQGIHTEHLPVPNIQSTQLARAVASGKECIPALLVLGSVLQYFQRRPPTQTNEIFIVFVPSTLGPCRTGQYHVFYDHLFAEMGWENVIVLVGESENSYRELGPNVSQDIWRSAVLADHFTDVRTGIQLLADDVELGMQVFNRVWQEILQAFGENPRSLDKALTKAGQELAAIPKKRQLDAIKKILVVGEIYVRRDTFSVRELNEFLISRSIFPKVTGVTEWIYYTDYARKVLMREQTRREGIFLSTRHGLAKEASWFVIETTWKHHIDAKVRKALAPAGFIPDVPHDMDRVIREGAKCFVDPALESEATVSPAVAGAAMADGYSGVAVIAPFGCLPGRLIEGVYAPWAKAKGYPVIALENDGQPYPPGTVARMEVFAENVLRYHKHDSSVS